MRRAGGRQQGFAVLMLLLVVGVLASLAGIAAWTVPALGRGRLPAGQELLARLAGETRAQVALTRVAPRDLDSLLANATGCSAGLTSIDPFGGGRTLGYAVAGPLVTLRSRGPDGRLGTADDLLETLSTEPACRAATRSRLRLLRARYLTSRYVFYPGSKAGDRVLLSSELSSWAAARRELAQASGARASELSQRIADAAARVRAVLLAAGAPAAPTQLTGGAGLLAALGLPDALAVDGFGNPLLPAVAGFASAGADGVPDTADDL